MRVIDRIANLILEDPLITAERIAHRLGYAEEKTVYYWLNKSHFAGLNAFKKAVLHGQFIPVAPHAARETEGLYGRLPVASAWTDDGAPIFDGDTLALPLGAPAELVWRYSGPSVLHILPQDLLVLTAVDPTAPSPWVVAKSGTAVVLRLATVHAGHLIATDPLTLKRDSKCHPLYQILQLIRHY